MHSRADDGRPEELSSLELAVMSLVWELGECASSDVVQAFRERVRPLAPTTIRTVLSHIEKKGYLERVPSVDRTLRYRPVVTRDKVARRSLRRLVETLFQGKATSAVSSLIGDEPLDAEDIEEIRTLLDRNDAARKRSPSGKKRSRS
jgi:predicted transcriptional regulator